MNKYDQIQSKVKDFLKKDYVPWLFVMIVFGYLLHITWLKWGNLIIDFSRELYVPTQLLKGKMLFKDIQYAYGPFSPFFNAFLCVIFGVHLKAFIISGLLTIVLTCIILFYISKIFLNSYLSAFIVIIFLFVGAFSHTYESGIFNYVFPYSYAATHSMLFCLSALLSFYYNKKTFVSLFIFLALITRIEMGLMILIVLSLGVLFDVNKDLKVRIKELIYHYLIPLLLAGFVYSSFFLFKSDTLSQSLNLFSANLKTTNPFTGKLAGVSNLIQNLKYTGISVLYFLIISILFFVFGKVSFLLTNKLDKKLKYIIITIITSSLLFIIIWFQNHYYPFYFQYRFVPLITLFLIVLSYMRYMRGAQKKNLFLAVVALFSLLVLSRMLFNVWIGHYGFSLLVPGLLCYYVFFLDMIPRLTKRKEVQNYYKICFVVIVCVLTMNHFKAPNYFYKNKTLNISSDRGEMVIFPTLYRYVELVNYIVKHTKSTDTLVVFPEGVSINFFTRRVNPLANYTFLPIDFVFKEFEEKTIRELELNKVKYVVIVSRDTSEYGAGRFGLDYAKDIMKYLQYNYLVEKQFGAFPFTSSEFTTVLLRRVDKE